MKVSIVTPSFNQGRYIKDCIDSVRNQSYRPIEHIIYDNCSTDETKQILEEYKQNPEGIDVRIFIEPDKGQSDALNKGFKTATGDVVGWLNTDESYMPETVSKVIQFWRTNKEAAVLFGDCIFIDNNKKVIKAKEEFGYDYKMLLYYGCYIPTCATFFKKIIFDEGIFLDIAYKNCMDFELFVRLANNGKQFIHMPEYLSLFTYHVDNISTVYALRRHEERLKVQLNYGVKISNDKLRIFIFEILRWSYALKRNLMRLQRRFSRFNLSTIKQ